MLHEKHLEIDQYSLTIKPITVGRYAWYICIVRIFNKVYCMLTD